jgi:hypothetical protein
MRQPKGQDVLCVARRKQESIRTRYVGAKSDRTTFFAQRATSLDADTRHFILRFADQLSFPREPFGASVILKARWNTQWG